MFKRFVITLVLVVASAGGASAQQWDAPLFFSPRPMDDLGIYYVNSDRCCGFENSNGLKLIWRQSGNLNLGVHAGTGDIENIGESILLGAELYGGLPGLSASSGLAMAWSLGLGAAFGEIEATGIDYVDFSVPLGVSVGIPINAGGATILPYIHPRVSLDVASFTDQVTDEEDTETDVGFAVDIGADVNLGQSLILRTGFALGDRDAFGVGVAFRMARRVVAR
ncbi:MAG TPA: hypothetical protein VGD27_05810 [Longimicrobiales bacterium]